MSRVDARRHLSVLVVVGALWSAGCYESEFPLESNPETAIERGLIGTWRCLPIGDATSDHVAILVVSFPEWGVYEVTWTETDGTGHRYRAYGSSVMARLVNVQDIGSGAGSWRFVRYTLLRQNIVHLQVVSENALKGVPRIRTFVRQQIDRLRGSPSLFADLGVCARTSS